MQSPYVVGRWVRGKEHYDRQSLIEYLLNVPDTALWVVGTRRMGKTSLLHQLELVAERPESIHVPLFWDLQGGTTPDELTLRSADGAGGRGGAVPQRPGWNWTDLLDEDAVTIVRRLARDLMWQGRHLLLLMDEAEMLVEIARVAPYLAGAFAEGAARGQRADRHRVDVWVDRADAAKRRVDDQPVFVWLSHGHPVAA